MPGTELGKAYVQIVPSAEGIKGSISKVLSGESADAGHKSGNKIVSAMKKVIAAAGIGAAVKKSLDIGGDLQQSYLGGLDTLYGDAADAARKYADEAYKAGISMNDYAEQAVSFGASLKSAFGGDVTKAAEAANTAIMDMADNSAKMGTDIGSVQAAYQGFAKQNYTMLDNLKLGYGGTKTEMERLLKEADKLNAEQGKITNYSIDNLGDVYEAIHVVQGSLELTGVAADEAAETFSGSMGAMKAAAENLMGNIALGQNVEESMQALIDTSSTFFFNNLIPMIGTLIKSLPTAISTFIKKGIPLLLNNISKLVSDLAGNVKKFAEGITSEKVEAWAKTSGVQMLKKGAEIIGKFASGLLENIGTLLVSLGKIGLEVVKGLGSAIWPKVKEAAEGVRERFMAPIESLKEKVKDIIDKIKGFFSFKISAPHIPLPHFSISPSGWKIGDLLKGTLPTLGISWNAKAMENPYMFSNATLFGAGEKGDEMLYGRKALLRDIREATGSRPVTITNTFTINNADDPERVADAITRRLRLQMRSI